VNHKILLDELEFYGIEGKFKTLIESYRTGRYQKVILSSSSSNNNNNNNNNNNSSLKWELIKNGVPQGSILGPPFFLLFINNLPKIITENNTMVLFAEDTSLLITDSNNLDFNININRSFCNIITWFNSNLLILKFNKSTTWNLERKIITRLKLRFNMNTKIFQIPLRLNFWD
jgi:hypothetical protein